MSATVLDVRGIHAKYGKRTRLWSKAAEALSTCPAKGVTFAGHTLSGVSLRIAAGEWFCLLGPNGVGKSTLLRCISGALRPSAGDLLIAGHSAVTDPIAAKRHLGYACAPEQLPGLLTGAQCLEVYAQAKGLQALDTEVLELAAQLQFRAYLDRFVDTYSLGTRQKLCILLALLGEPTLIVLDEAFNGLDPGSALTLKRHLQQRLALGRSSVLLATHSLDIVEHYADKAALLIDGRIVREWSEAEIAGFREQGANAMEAALAAECRTLSLGERAG